MKYGYIDAHLIGTALRTSIFSSIPPVIGDTTIIADTNGNIYDVEIKYITKDCAYVQMLGVNEDFYLHVACNRDAYHINL